jgi:hypothetical protein
MLKIYIHEVIYFFVCKKKGKKLFKYLQKFCIFCVEKCHPVSYDTFWDQMSPQEKKFFKALEDNLNKVENFYDSKYNNDL